MSLCCYNPEHRRICLNIVSIYYVKWFQYYNNKKAITFDYNNQLLFGDLIFYTNKQEVLIMHIINKETIDECNNAVNELFS